MPTRIAVHGAAGRMGCRVVALAAKDADFQVVAAIEAPAHPNFGQDAGQVAGIGPLGVAIGDQLPDEVDAVIDFSVPAAAAELATRCAERRLPLVVATTGMDEQQAAQIRSAAQQIPIVWAPNMSLAVNLAMKLAQVAARSLRDHPEGVDVEIIEWHHRFKQDAPSGTALRFGQLIGEAMGQTRQRHGREGLVGERPRDEIGYHAVRAGDNPGEHTILFGLLGESLELAVRATSRDCYARGALAAARYVVAQPPGLYNMFHVLGLDA